MRIDRLQALQIKNQPLKKYKDEQSRYKGSLKETRFRDDPAMSGKKLGKSTKQGYEVFERGKLIGYYK